MTTSIEPIARAICAKKDSPGKCRARECHGGLRCLFWSNHIPEAEAAVAAYEKTRGIEHAAT